MFVSRRFNIDGVLMELHEALITNCDHTAPHCTTLHHTAPWQLLVVTQEALNRNPKWFPAPDAFKPERFKQHTSGQCVLRSRALKSSQELSTKPTKVGGVGGRAVND